MRVIGPDEIRRRISARAAIAAMRDAVLAQARGECDTPMPMHVDLSAGGGGEVHIKSSYRRGGRHFALKVAGTYVRRPYGSIVLISVETGETAVYFDDGGYLTDLRTAAVAAMVARELGRRDTALGILGSGVQARLQAQLHAEVLPLERVHVWGRNPARAAACAGDIARLLPGVHVAVAGSPEEVAASATLIATTTAARAPLLRAGDVRPGSHISAVGADSPGKQELDPELLGRASLLLVDSRAQCERLGELQHALSERGRAVEIGAFCAAPVGHDRAGITVADFTGLGAEDLFIAEACAVG
ncbi:MAG: ornithine cyclodeaminase family protein [Deltaproteobacteria bacterium]|nr:MAG: ornithine cyclodeaminase family protein [Deltaproteobacteria bacterium]TMQ26745.1 MAG: ornithine cyclodeaminase family protein [Deltaproteobacteria bacterium]